MQCNSIQSTVAVVSRYSGQGRCIIMLANQTSRDRHTHTHTCIYNTVLLATKNTLRLGCIIIINILYIIYFTYYYHYYYTNYQHIIYIHHILDISECSEHIIIISRISDSESPYTG